MKINFRKIFSRRLYRQGGACIPFFIATPYCGAFTRTKGGFFYNKGELNYGYFFKDNEKRIASRALARQEKDKNYVKKLFRKWKDVADKQLSFGDKINKLDFAKLSWKELVKLHQKFDNYYFRFWYHAVIIEAYDPWGNELLNEKIQKYYGKALPFEVVKTMTAPSEISYLNQEYLELFNLAKIAFKNKIDLTKPKEFLNFYKKLGKHKDKYYWTNNGWVKVYRLNEIYFLKRIKAIIRNFSQARKKAKKIIFEQKYIKNRKKNYLRKYRFSKELINIFYYFEFLNFWRDFRKTYGCKYHDVLYRFLKEYSRRTNISINYLKSLTALEIGKIKNYTKKDIKKLKERWECCFMLYRRPKNYLWFIGKEAEKLIKLLDKYFIGGKREIRGSIGNKGKIKGMVRLIKTISDFKKMKKGDILVSVATRTEYAPIMNKAKAIITDEGGITCHAAIVSRELSIPCIVGTQIATKVLKDGDKVEVDANKGIIKKIR